MTRESTRLTEQPATWFYSLRPLLQTHQRRTYLFWHRQILEKSRMKQALDTADDLDRMLNDIPQSR